MNGSLGLFVQWSEDSLKLTVHHSKFNATVPGVFCQFSPQYFSVPQTNWTSDCRVAAFSFHFLSFSWANYHLLLKVGTG